MPIKIVTVIIASIIFLLVVELIREEKLTFKYALGWLAVSLMAIVLSLFDFVIIAIARFFGFELASNFIFFSLLCVMVFLSLYMTLQLCQQNSHNDAMAQKIAMLEYEIERLKKDNPSHE